MPLDDLDRDFRNLALLLRGEQGFWRFGGRDARRRGRGCGQLGQNRRLGNDRPGWLQIRGRVEDDCRKPDGRVGLVRLVHDLLKAVVRDDVQSVRGNFLGLEPGSGVGCY